MTTPEHEETLTPDQHATLAFEDTWTSFLEARASLREVMTDDELREFGINVDELDTKPGNNQ